MTMRRRLERFIPIVLFAVLVQLLAPIGAFRAVATMVSDPSAMASICSGMVSQSDRHGAPADRPAAQCCAFCACAHGDFAVSAETPPGLSPWRPHFQIVNWLERTALASTVRTGSNAQARAPPARA
jgi:hypothetical protein